MSDLRGRLFPGLVIAFVVLSAITAIYAYSIRVQVSQNQRSKKKLDMKVINDGNIYLKVMFYLSLAVLLFMMLGIGENCTHDCSPICHPIMYGSLIVQSVLNCVFLLMTFALVDAVQQKKDLSNYRHSSLDFGDIYEIYIIGFASVANAIFIGWSWYTGNLE